MSVTALYNQLKGATTDAAQGPLLEQIKLLLYTSSCDPVMAREILELGLLHSLRVKDMPAFERYYAQLKPFYQNASLAPSQRMFTILGLNLLRLLAQNKIADFHTSLEELGLEQLNNIYIKHPIHVEQCLMEGSYNKVWNSRANVPAQEYLFFIDILMSTIRYAKSFKYRNEIASCCEKTYESLMIPDAATLLYFKNAEEILKFAHERQWVINTSDNKIYFDTEAQEAVDIPAEKMIRLALGYARELERIV